MAKKLNLSPDIGLIFLVIENLILYKMLEADFLFKKTCHFLILFLIFFYLPDALESNRHMKINISKKNGLGYIDNHAALHSTL